MIRRLPGLRFDAAPPQPATTLPRMDVAAFVGFAAAGPLHLPVAVEDPAQFAAIFGDDLALAWDRRAGAPARAFLGPAVRAFFRGGGRRCWVVRVAGDHAHTRAFRLAGLRPLASPGDQLVFARSPGSWSDGLGVAATLAARSLLPVPPPDGPPLFAAAEGEILSLTLVADPPLVPGDLLRLNGGADLATLLLTVEAAPTPGRGAAQAVTAQVVHRIDPALSPPLSPPDAAVPAVEQLSCDLWARQGDGSPVRLRGLGFDPRHPRYLGALPSDATLFGPRPPARLGEPDYSGLYSETAAPRFPLAGGAAGLLLPLGLPAQPDHFAGPEPTALETLVRDGLDDFGPHLFLDPDLAELRATSLMAEADWWRYQAPRPRLLSGIHALLAVEEVSLVAAPDALHPGWSQREPTLPAPVEAPDPPARPAWWRFLDCDEKPPAEPLAEPQRTGLPDPLAPSLAEGRFRPGLIELRWTAPRGVSGPWLLEEADRPDFTGARVAYSGVIQRARLLGRTPGDYFYRVRSSAAAGEVWSNGVAIRVPPGVVPLAEEPRGDQFIGCADRVVPAPPASLRLLAGPDGAGSFRLGWDASGPGARYRVEEARRPDWTGARMIAELPGLELSLYSRPAGDYYYRVRAELNGAVSDWSSGLAVGVRETPPWELREPGDDLRAAYDTAAAVQRAMLRMCAARGDMLAVLGLPAGAREEASLALLRLLAAPDAPTLSYALRPLLSQPTMRDVAPIGYAEAHVLSYGAAYHPWLLTRDEARPGELRAIPPEGAACGLCARRANEAGAWVAPANRPLPAVAGLEPLIGRERYLELQAGRLNLIRQEPRGPLALSADTLSSDPDLQLIGVRRLLILLRRLALREGMAYVFEPNSPAFRRAVQRNFEELLARLFARGAFAGSRPEGAYQALVDADPQEHERGRLVVELRVAPAQPLRFLTVRLVQSAERARVVEGV